MDVKKDGLKIDGDRGCGWGPVLLKDLGDALEITTFSVDDVYSSYDQDVETVINYPDLVKFMEEAGFQFKKFCYLARPKGKGTSALCSGIYRDKNHMEMMGV